VGPRLARDQSELLSFVQGNWDQVGEENPTRLEVTSMKLAFLGSSAFESIYLLLGNQISFNNESGIQTYQVAFDKDNMIWTEVASKKTLKFKRS
jgi:hypothetical protein